MPVERFGAGVTAAPTRVEPEATRTVGLEGQLVDNLRTLVPSERRVRPRQGALLPTVVVARPAALLPTVVVTRQVAHPAVVVTRQAGLPAVVVTRQEE